MVKGMVLMSGKSLFYGFVTGSIIAGAVTLLATPKSGTEVQKLVVTNANELINSLSCVKEKTLKLKSQVETVAKEGSTTIKSVSNEVQNSIKEWKKDVEPTMTDIQKSIQELHETIDQLEREIKKPLI